ncbi:metal ABC transporter solute-binding protein, Zn/Mn family [Plastoroseomonas arctica]|uniref:Zinc ABC transporter solute-binding protein n=1 Tax=Plastoroseomonas arctica TaxID=1509237 RepID=A0AAF1JWV0_9PROT|nr:zinc ABC transporter substrate-binding protein [Plastoroseomonas arctica]MBR0655549.1 zinc ABC transporter solute-binding protein [Plastoroseomonas arctica]
MHRRALLATPFLATIRPARAQAPLAVAASFSILADMARQIGGARVTVTAIVGSDVDSHGFQARPSDAASVRNAALVLRNGLNFEPWLDRLLGASTPRGRVVTATERMALRGMGAPVPADRTGPRRPPDPHGWQDLGRAALYVSNIEAGLIAADPAGAETYRDNARAYRARLAVLDAWVRAEIASVPEARRKIITGHDAFGYFAEAYGVTFLAPQGMAPQGEPTAAAIGALVRQARAERISAIFLENATSPAILERLAQEAGMQVRGRLYADALSVATGPAPTYEAMMRHNVTLMVPAMRGNAA